VHLSKTKKIHMVDNFILLLFFFPGWNYMLDNCPSPAPHFLIYYVEVEILVKLLSIMDTYLRFLDLVLCCT